MNMLAADDLDRLDLRRELGYLVDAAAVAAGLGSVAELHYADGDRAILASGKARATQSSQSWAVALPIMKRSECMMESYARVSLLRTRTLVPEF